MCTGAEPAAAGAAGAKGAAEVGAGYGLASGAEALDASLIGIGSGSTIAGSGSAFEGLAAGGAAGAAAGAATSGTGGASATTPTLSNVAAGASAANAGVGLLSALKGAPRTPTIAPPIPMPTTDDLAASRARSAAISKLTQRRGRASTILSNDTLGGS